jgi:hypothetical protein
MERRIRAFKGEVRQHAKVGRNELCKCKSGKKFKNCCKTKGIVFKKFDNPENN